MGYRTFNVTSTTGGVLAVLENDRRSSVAFYNTGGTRVSILNDIVNRIETDGFPISAGGSVAFNHISGSDPTRRYYVISISTGGSEVVRVLEEWQN